MTNHDHFSRADPYSLSSVHDQILSTLVIVIGSAQEEVHC